MKLSQIKNHLNHLETIGFQLPNGDMVASHFHVTEIGIINKRFIDCGGTVRKEDVINFQLWEANDYNHRLHPEKLVHIIQLSEQTLNLPDLEIEVEYQGETIGKYGLDFDGVNFVLTTTKTDCLAKSDCGIPTSKAKVALSSLNSKEEACCSPDSGCC